MASTSSGVLANARREPTINGAFPPRGSFWVKTGSATGPSSRNLPVLSTTPEASAPTFVSEPSASSFCGPATPASASPFTSASAAAPDAWTAASSPPSSSSGAPSTSVTTGAPAFHDSGTAAKACGAPKASTTLAPDLTRLTTSSFAASEDGSAPATAWNCVSWATTATTTPLSSWGIKTSTALRTAAKRSAVKARAAASTSTRSRSRSRGLRGAGCSGSGGAAADTTSGMAASFSASDCTSARRESTRRATSAAPAEAWADAPATARSRSGPDSIGR
nr:hypothetical protein [Myxococcus xanthus]